ncbi:hypothetical protein JFT85_02485 [Pseudomonas sp. TH04]|uniref:hypothetical protein n=1 Tax=Pseudomonas sp. TH04 TaxID=2796370 RepID=UPI001913EA01|nr:hypothetical protein [Pseudomonas sp. TH04]MBK5543636.1 hypothetical protein [Pseudomonas sp. TH04]
MKWPIEIHNDDEFQAFISKKTLPVILFFFNGACDFDGNDTYVIDIINAAYNGKAIYLCVTENNLDPATIELFKKYSINKLPSYAFAIPHRPNEVFTLEKPDCFELGDYLTRFLSFDYGTNS